MPETQRVQVSALTTGEARVLTYGALYHPWVLSRPGAGEEIIRLPPDGPICGMVAARALARGAWVPPANVPLRDVLALEPTIERAGWARLFAAQVNLIRPEPRGFLSLSADTLASEEHADLHPLNVRRLLTLLRRAALQRGMTYVFQPNDEAFRRRVHHGFETLLGDLFARGAFRGDTPETAFRVVTDASVNPRESLEQGRFVVELRVAPSWPLAFLTVRLVQTGDRGLMIKEV